MDVKVSQRIRSFVIVSSMIYLTPVFALPKAPQDFVSESSRAVESRVHRDLALRYDELTNQLPVTPTSFLNGEIFISPRGLIWRNLLSQEKTIVESNSLPEGHTIGGFEISPDGLKVAYFSSYKGQDLRHWNIISLKEHSRPWFREAALNRMGDLSWNAASTGIFYSYFNDKNEVAQGRKPINEVRFRDISGRDQLIFSPALAENFSIFDIGDGKTLGAYRLLNPDSGIKTTFSLYKGVRRDDGSYVWESAYPRNRHIGFGIGVYHRRVLILTSEVGDTYGVVAVDLSQKNQSFTLVPARPNQVLHMATLDQNHGKLILQYHSVPEQNVSIVIHEINSGRQTEISMDSLGLTEYGDLGRFIFAPGSAVSRAQYADVFQGTKILELDSVAEKIKVLPNLKSHSFASSLMNQQLLQFEAEGELITGRLYTRKGTADPHFIFIRHYGWIGIKNSPEPREVMLALDAGGAYFTVDLPGGGERGANWYRRGASNRLKSMRLLAATSKFLQNKFNVGPEKIVLMGRSWGGLTSLLMATYHPKEFGIISAVAPIIDLRDFFKNGWFGRIAHSDLDPRIDDQGNYILDAEFDSYVSRLNPIERVADLSAIKSVYLFTSGLDDRVDADSSTESDYAYYLSQQLNAGSFSYHRSIHGNHAARYYQVLMFSLLLEHFKIEFQPAICGTGKKPRLRPAGQKSC